MNKVTNFNKATARVVGDGAVKALAEYAKSLGLSVQGKGGTFEGNGGSFTLRVDFALLEKDGKPFDARAERAAEDFRQSATLYELEAADLGATFTMHGTSYKVVGLLPNKRSKPILIERLHDKKRFCAAPESIARLLHAGAKAERAPLLDFPNAAVRGAA